MQGAINLNKCKVYAPSHTHQQLLDLNFPTLLQYSNEGTKVLGVPIGNDNFILSFLEEKIKSIEKQCDLVSHMTSQHCQLSIISKSIQHQMTFLLRNIPCGDISFLPLAARYDKAITSVVKRICHHTNITKAASGIARLPHSMGGLALKSFNDLADPAFLASHVFCSTIIPNICPNLNCAFEDVRYIQLNQFSHQSPTLSDHSKEAFLAYQRLNSNSNHKLHDMLQPSSILTHLHLLQATLSNINSERQRESIISDIRNDTSKYAKYHYAHYISSQQDSYSFNVTPIDTDTTLTNRQLCIALSRRLGLPIIKISDNKSSVEYYFEFVCPSCNKFTDWFGFHAFCCRGDGHAARTKYLHDPIVRLWVRLLRHAGYTVILEPTGYVFTNNKRPDFIIIQRNGSQLFVDVRTCDPLLKANLDQCCANPGYAAQLGVKEKENDWLDLLKSQGDNFLAICHEHPGLISDGALALLDSAAEKFSSTTTGRAAFKAYWLPRLHITNLRGTADILNCKLPFAAELPISSQPISHFTEHFSPFAGYLPLPSPILHN